MAALAPKDSNTRTSNPKVQHHNKNLSSLQTCSKKAAHFDWLPKEAQATQASKGRAFYKVNTTPEEALLLMDALVSRTPRAAEKE